MNRYKSLNYIGAFPFLLSALLYTPVVFGQPANSPSIPLTGTEVITCAQNSSPRDCTSSILGKYAITQPLPIATAPLTGSEAIPCNQNATAKNCTPSEVSSYVISQLSQPLPNATLPLSGSEATICIQGATTKDCNLSVTSEMAKYNDKVANVVDFGADKTGANDSSNAFNLAIQAAGSGGRVIVPNGTYLINSAPWGTSPLNIIFDQANGVSYTGNGANALTYPNWSIGHIATNGGGNQANGYQMLCTNAAQNNSGVNNTTCSAIELIAPTTGSTHQLASYIGCDNSGNTNSSGNWCEGLNIIVNNRNADLQTNNSAYVGLEVNMQSNSSVAQSTGNTSAGASPTAAIQNTGILVTGGWGNLPSALAGNAISIDRSQGAWNNGANIWHSGTGVNINAYNYPVYVQTQYWGRNTDPYCYTNPTTTSCTIQNGIYFDNTSNPISGTNFSAGQLNNGNTMIYLTSKGTSGYFLDFHSSSPNNSLFNVSTIGTATLNQSNSGPATLTLNGQSTPSVLNFSIGGSTQSTIGSSYSYPFNINVNGNSNPNIYIDSSNNVTLTSNPTGGGLAPSNGGLQLNNSGLNTMSGQLTINNSPTQTTPLIINSSNNQTNATILQLSYGGTFTSSFGSNSTNPVYIRQSNSFNPFYTDSINTYLQSSSGGVFRIGQSLGYMTMPLQITGTTFANLHTCSAAYAGMIATINDLQAAPTNWMQPITQGGGTINGQVICTGNGWYALTGTYTPPSNVFGSGNIIAGTNITTSTDSNNNVTISSPNALTASNISASGSGLTATASGNNVTLANTMPFNTTSLSAGTGISINWSGTTATITNSSPATGSATSVIAPLTLDTTTSGGSYTPLILNTPSSSPSGDNLIQLQNNGTTLGYIGARTGYSFNVFSPSLQEVLRIDSNNQAFFNTSTAGTALNTFTIGQSFSQAGYGLQFSPNTYAQVGNKCSGTAQGLIEYFVDVPTPLNFLGVINAGGGTNQYLGMCNGSQWLAISAPQSTSSGGSASQITGPLVTSGSTPPITNINASISGGVVCAEGFQCNSVQGTLAFGPLTTNILAQNLLFNLVLDPNSTTNQNQYFNCFGNVINVASPAGTPILAGAAGAIYTPVGALPVYGTNPTGINYASIATNVQLTSGNSYYLNYFCTK